MGLICVWKIISQVLYACLLAQEAIIYLSPIFRPWEGAFCPPMAGNGQFVGCSGEDCPFHPFASFRLTKSSSLLLSQWVNSRHVLVNKALALSRHGLRRAPCLQLPGLSSLQFEERLPVFQTDVL